MDSSIFRDVSKVSPESGMPTYRAEDLFEAMSSFVYSIRGGAAGLGMSIPSKVFPRLIPIFKTKPLR
jgi:hypothetical protein